MARISVEFSDDGTLNLYRMPAGLFTYWLRQPWLAA